WNVPTYILYGEKDDLCEKDVILKFTDKFSCKLKIDKEAEHYFHTPEQMMSFKEWLSNVLD
ncbi:MAG: alpha/beta hydrolase, partial [Clostridium sp.]